MGGTLSHVAVTKLYTKYLYSDEKITSCGGQNKTPDHASVIAQKALMLADRSQEKLLNSTNCQVLLSCAVLAFLPTYPCSQLAPLSPTVLIFLYDNLL
jgi:hypothetical protein